MQEPRSKRPRDPSTNARALAAGAGYGGCDSVGLNTLAFLPARGLARLAETCWRFTVRPRGKNPSLIERAVRMPGRVWRCSTLRELYVLEQTLAGARDMAAATPTPSMRVLRKVAVELGERVDGVSHVRLAVAAASVAPAWCALLSRMEGATLLTSGALPVLVRVATQSRDGGDAAAIDAAWAALARHTGRSRACAQVVAETPPAAAGVVTHPGKLSLGVLAPVISDGAAPCVARANAARVAGALLAAGAVPGPVVFAQLVTALAVLLSALSSAEEREHEAAFVALAEAWRAHGRAPGGLPRLGSATGAAEVSVSRICAALRDKSNTAVAAAAAWCLQCGVDTSADMASATGDVPEVVDHVVAMAGSDTPPAGAGPQPQWRLYALRALAALTRDPGLARRAMDADCIGAIQAALVAPEGKRQPVAFHTAAAKSLHQLCLLLGDEAVARAREAGCLASLLAVAREAPVILPRVAPAIAVLEPPAADGE